LCKLRKLNRKPFRIEYILAIYKLAWGITRVFFEGNAFFHDHEKLTQRCKAHRGNILEKLHFKIMTRYKKRAENLISALFLMIAFGIAC